jgi:copper chaperone CopZ
MSSEVTTSYVVDGMTCEHCRAAVSQEVSKVAGVSAVDVDLATGELAVRGTAVDEGAVREAVEEAGYAVVS